MDSLSSLNENQKKAVTASLGPVLVLAGAGSGKTKALTHRIAYLVDSKAFRASEILAVTFTNKAANEMKERIENLLGGSKEMPSIGTFHSICSRLLRSEIHLLPPFNSNFTIFDSEDSLRVIKQIFKTMDIGDQELSPTYIRSIISSIKNQMTNIDSLENDQIVNIYKSYEKTLRELNALDFDDLLVYTMVLFKSHPKVLSKYNTKWRYILVDEYQDTNNLQYELIKLLVNKERNIFAVGDDAQSIYGFRGANYYNILNFEKDFSDAQVFMLDQNYRSSQVILSVANEVIKLSPEQKVKKLWTKNPDGKKIVIYNSENEVTESVFVAEQILEYAQKFNDNETSEPVYLTDQYDDEILDEGNNHRTDFFDRLMKMNGLKNAQVSRSKYKEIDNEKLKEIAILYRTNAQSRALEEVLLQFGIPYNIVGSLRFYERKEIKDILSYLRLLLNNLDYLSLLRIVSVPPRGLGDKSLQYIQSGQIEALTPKARNAWDQFQAKLESIRQTPDVVKLIEIVDIILKKFNLKDFYVDGSSEGNDRWENIKELMTVADRFSHLNWRVALQEFLEEIALYSDTDEIGTKPGVTLMTLHQAKGLEFNVVFIVGMEEGLLPHTRSLEPGGDINEEIRLAYVGITRAKKHLYLTHTNIRRIWGSNMSLRPSRILKVIPEEFVEERNGSWSY